MVRSGPKRPRIHLPNSTCSRMKRAEARLVSDTPNTATTAAKATPSPGEAGASPRGPKRRAGRPSRKVSGTPGRSRERKPTPSGKSSGCRCGPGCCGPKSSPAGRPPSTRAFDDPAADRPAATPKSHQGQQPQDVRIGLHQGLAGLPQRRGQGFGREAHRVRFEGHRRPIVAGRRWRWWAAKKAARDSAGPPA